jgi:hypothetical protein
MKRTAFEELEQGTTEWRMHRLGCVTASEFSTAMEGTGKEKAGRKKYMLKLAGERITGELAENFTYGRMEDGHDKEIEARELYSLIHSVEVEQVGFFKLGDEIGYSPDGVVESDGLWETKSRMPHILLELHRTGTIPKKDLYQCQGGLWVADREWIDYMAYWPGMKPFIKRLHRDKGIITTIKTGVDSFLEELHETVEWYNQIGG